MTTTTQGTATAAPTTAAQLDQLADQLNQISETLAEVMRHGHIPTTVAAVAPLAWARGNLDQTANMITAVADQLDSDGSRYDECADDAWADPDWRVDSTTRTCCGGIGNHTRECDRSQLTPDSAAARSNNLISRNMLHNNRIQC